MQAKFFFLRQQTIVLKMNIFLSSFPPHTFASTTMALCLAIAFVILFIPTAHKHTREKFANDAGLLFILLDFMAMLITVPSNGYMLQHHFCSPILNVDALSRSLALPTCVCVYFFCCLSFVCCSRCDYEAESSSG